MILTAFDDVTPDLGWRMVNDNVMGGRSYGNFRIESGSLLLSGSLNTRGGGFASVRSAAAALPLAGAECLELRVRGDGRTYSLGLQTRSDITYWSEFSATGEWQVVRLSLAEFEPRWRGRRLDGPAPAGADIVGINLMIADKTDGPFRLEVDWIGGCSA